MKKENFKKLEILDKVRVNTVRGEMVGVITYIDDVHAEILCKEPRDIIISLPSAIISKIVKRKKPKLEFFGTACLRKDGAYHALGPQWVIDSCISKEKHPDDTHEVFVRPIVRKK